MGGTESYVLVSTNWFDFLEVFLKEAEVVISEVSFYGLELQALGP